MKRRNFFGVLGAICISPTMLFRPQPQKQLKGIWYYHHKEDRAEFYTYLGTYTMVPLNPKDHTVLPREMEFKGSYTTPGTNGPQHLVIKENYWKAAINTSHVIPVYNKGGFS